jgi:hypothetical protein
MTRIEDPPRLRHLLGEQGDPLASALDELRATTPTAPELYDLGAKLGVAVAPPTLGAATGAATTLKALPFGKWLSVFVAPFAVGAGLGTAMVVGSQLLVPRTFQVSESSSVSIPSSSTPAPHDPAARASANAMFREPPPPLAPTAAKESQENAPLLDEQSDSTRGPSERELLWRARRALDHDPLLTLSLTSDHALRFGADGLTQEREVLVIDALLRLGRRSEAERRTAEFRARFPGSVYVRRLDVLMADQR